LRLQPVEREPQPEQRRVQITPVLVVQFVRVGYLGDQLQGVADVLCRRFFGAALGPAAALRGATLALAAPLLPRATLDGDECQPMAPLAAAPLCAVAAADSGTPLVGASVVIVGTVRSVLTNDKGQYRLSVPAGVRTVRARLIGYEAAEQRVTVAAGQTVTADFKLAATPLSLNEVVV